MIKNNRFLDALLLLSIFALVFVVVVMASVPPVSRDALTHHLAIPKLWVEQGSITVIPHLLYSYYPMNLDLLYALPMMFGNDILPKYIHFLFALLTAWLIYRYLASQVDRWLSLLGALFFLSTPVILKLSISAYVDLGLVCFSWTSIHFLFQWGRAPDKIRYLLLSAIFCGLGLGTKYNGLLVLFLLVCLVTVVFVRSTDQKLRKMRMIIGYPLLFGLTALLVFSPWMIRNVRLTGNPIYPLYQRQFSSGKDAPETANMSMRPWVQRKLIYRESALETALIPLRIFFQGRDDDPRFFDGQLNPMLCLFPLLLLLKNKKRDAGAKLERFVLAAFSFLFLIYASFMVDMRIRYITPIIPPLTVLAVLGVGNLLKKIDRMESVQIKKAGYGFVGIVITGLLGLNAQYLAQQMRSVNPLPYVFGEMTREEYLKEQLPEYAAVQAVNRITGDDVNVLALFLGKRLYYFDKPVRFEMQMFADMVNCSTDEKDLSTQLRMRGFSHCIIGIRLFNGWADQIFDDRQKRIISKWWRHDCQLLFSKNGYTVLALKHHDNS